MYILKFYYICNTDMNYDELTDEELKELYEDSVADYYIDLYKSM